ncbi:GTPase HflX [Pseudooceanicola sp.]|uniref:GTPase HflX n=1 Tax=Pseudooceanicola sp. TaxID=1914328 RepID=UPI0040582C08
MPHDRPVTRAWVLHPDLTGEDRRHAPEYALEEAVSLALALPDLQVVGQGVVNLRKAVPATLFGSGKIEEIKAEISDQNVELVLVDGSVTPVQQRNLEKKWGVKLLDRTGLILEIFSDRARTREGVLQVEMAALAYQRTRLVRAWTHLERQRGGLGFVGGPGETQIEADRRAIDEQLVRLRRQLDRVVRTRELHRAARAKVPFPIVALVGYTNAGKSTLFNRLTGAEVFVKDMLFATLDPTMRRVRLPNNGPEVILSDTVGFISDLPTQLVAAFRATLEEVLEADLILHVRDISHPESQEQKADVEDILNDLGLPDSVPVLEVWNKIDRLDEETRNALLNKADREEVFAISAVTGQGLAPLLQAIETGLEEDHLTEVLNLGFEEGRRRAWLFEQGVVTEDAQGDEGYRMVVRWTAKQAARFRGL